MRITVLLAAILLVMLVVQLARLRGRRTERHEGEAWSLPSRQSTPAHRSFGGGQARDGKLEADRVVRLHHVCGSDRAEGTMRREYNPFTCCWSRHKSVIREIVRLIWIDLIVDSRALINVQ